MFEVIMADNIFPNFIEKHKSLDSRVSILKRTRDMKEKSCICTQIYKKKNGRWAVVVHTFEPSMSEAETGRSQ